jgi:lipoprotein-releasing system permease protein
MPFAWFVALRYLRDARGQTALILAAVSVGVAVVVFLSALMGGLHDSLVEKTLGSQAHIRMSSPREAPRPVAEEGPGRPAIARLMQPAAQRLRSIDAWPSVLAALQRTPGVVAASPLIIGPGFAVRADAKQPIVIRGVEPEAFLAIIDLTRRLVAGRFDVTGGQVGIGAGLAEDLQLSVGDKVRITTSEGVEDLVTVSGIFSLGNQAVDDTWLVTSLRHAQSLFALPGGATTLELKVTEIFEAQRIAGQLQDRTGLEVESWMTLNRDLLSGLSAQSSSKYVIQFFVVVTVALGIASVLAVSVVQKTREVGILRAVGTSSGRVLELFLIQGGVLGLAGSILGAGLGAALAKLFEGLMLDPRGTPKFPVTLDAGLFLGASALATGVGLLAAVLPARRAAHIDPASAIRDG